MKTIHFQPINESLPVKTQTDLLQALLAKNLNVLMSCGGKGLCSTCHVYIKEGMDRLTPRTERENRTLSYVTSVTPQSRLACQCRVLGEGVVVELPEGMYIERAEDLMGLLGTRAATNILHPINGSILIAKGKIITRTRLEELRDLNVEVERIRNSDD
ncbi:ferredoxin [Isosphaera pallida ATCC 43644]|jgi:ferredoxin|uniref:Ferredoxin n=1 Tax=Isosphaera pallida (strain ATCC 43644 / DSM 9630 / IS1B) TaxID=575540 RepID=E8R543_ISOPI|nr:2Fe-2S iron-sulfur cluster-binding protein [Isosphaera pallida]ADV62800.1 ferredoxin [Isosphaera pallida ATCC 43644]